MNKGTVLLVYPGGFNSVFPEIPLPLVYLAWALRRASYEVEILDTRIHSFDQMSRDDYLFVGISSMTGPMIRDGLRFARHVRERNPKIPIVWGGIHVTLLPEQSLENDLVDIVVRGEGELTVVELAGALAAGGALSKVRGISYKQDGVVRSNPDREFMDMDQIDIELPYDLLEMEKYEFPGLPVALQPRLPLPMRLLLQYRLQQEAMALQERCTGARRDGAPHGTIRADEFQFWSRG